MQRPGLDSENEMKSSRAGDAECCSGDPVQSLLVCVWGGAAAKSIKAHGLGGWEWGWGAAGGLRVTNMHYLTVHTCSTHTC